MNARDNSLTEHLFQTALAMNRVAAEMYAPKPLRVVAAEVVALIDGYVDVVDGDYGEPRPNKAMYAVQVLQGDYGKVDVAALDEAHELISDIVESEAKRGETRLTNAAKALMDSLSKRSSRENTSPSAKGRTPRGSG